MLSRTSRFLGGGILAEQTPVQRLRFTAWLESEPLVEFSRESLVPVGHRIPASERRLCF